MSYLQYNSSPLTKKSYLFGIRIVKMVKSMTCSPKEYGMINQVFRSGTAIGALVSEATYAQSPADFINKLSVALKECNETNYWLNILRDTEYLNEQEFESLSKDCQELLALLISSIKTTKQNNEKK
ncbi:MAG: four helix bundle protein [Prevotella sp.]|jgi:four helix bundle protein|nr:four helix bundle protein [Prevotella sp.]